MVSLKTNTMAPSEVDFNGIPCIDRLKEVHMEQRKGLTWTKQPYDILKYFILAFLEHSWQLCLHIMSHRRLLMLIFVAFIVWIALFEVNGPHEQFMQELLALFWYSLWWVGLGVASSIGLGSGLHTFVLYLGPHIAKFTIKTTFCGRADLKRACYDTAVFGMEPTWALKECSEFGQPLYGKGPSSERFQVPLLAILHEVQLEAILWGLGTAIGELPPYFVSRAARLSGERLRRMDDLTMENSADSSISFPGYLKQLKFLTITQFQHFNFWTILLFASVPNPFFDLAGMMCGQLLVPFWKFFIPTLIGKAIIKTHIQTVFIILVCNNQLVELLDNSLRWLFESMPAVSHIIAYITSKVHDARVGYGNVPKTGNKAAPWSLSFSLIWNTFVWIMLIGFFSSIIRATAQSYLMEKQKKEIEALQQNHQRSK
eukprot:c23317_g1_i1 orf=408-1691(+)